MYGKFQTYLQNELKAIDEAGLYKKERNIASPQSAEITLQDGSKALNFCANNYLGLADNPRLIAAAKQAMDSRGYGMSSVRFICGTQDIHKELEKAIADYFHTEDAILYAACFDANGGVFEPLFTAEDAIISDSLNHASIIDGVRLCKAQRLCQRRHGGPGRKTQGSPGLPLPHHRHGRRVLYGRQRGSHGQDLRPGR